ncbi:hypothetical protein E8E12_005045 [Didymella heteroderae]|uniref:Calcineurin-like phosphoesterase domain-containing protein n=1 Tax=Didymella heteroderae TaxID=1769908 RepID=A0A9P4WR09_9PLEO|nr:hypothetical protein E8E12_005045 [Didymella heteroderae]
MPTIKTLVISDTPSEWPYSSENLAPKVDVFILCGDLTQHGGLPSFQRAIDNISAVDAELKLIIAGNHDVDIDPAWLYGRSSTVNATPYTPKFGEIAFLYGKDEDRFNEGLSKMPEGVDIGISNRPPAFPDFEGSKLNVSKRGEDCGCEKLVKALERVKLGLACFGHIQEGRGAAVMDWEAKELRSEGETSDRSVISLSGKDDQTILINAAVLGDERGWFVDLAT